MTKGAVLVELFTSEGCSSCPPADELLNQLAGRADVVPLAFHVDYWDHLGWVSQFSSKRWTERQQAYAKAFRSRTLYTPQAVIAGRAECVGSDHRRLEGYIEQELSKTKGCVAPAIVGVQQISGGVDVTLAGEVANGARLFVALVEDGHEVRVTRGENAGRTLRHDRMVVDMATAERGPNGQYVATLRRHASVANPLQCGLVMFVQDDRLVVHAARYERLESR